MRSNALLKWLMIPAALLVVFVGIRLFSGSQSKFPANQNPQLMPEEMQALGIEGGTPRDTVATLVAQVRQLRGELQNTVAENKTQREENRLLREQATSIEQRANRPANASKPKVYSPICNAVWKASAGVMVMWICRSVWDCVKMKSAAITCVG